MGKQDTNIVDTNSDLIQVHLDRFTEARVDFMGALEHHLKVGAITLATAVQLFEKATMMQPKEAARYLQLMSSEGSAFKNLHLLKKRV